MKNMERWQFDYMPRRGNKAMNVCFYSNCQVSDNIKGFFEFDSLKKDTKVLFYNVKCYLYTVCDCQRWVCEGV